MLVGDRWHLPVDPSLSQLAAHEEIEPIHGWKQIKTCHAVIQVEMPGFTSQAEEVNTGIFCQLSPQGGFRSLLGNVFTACDFPLTPDKRHNVCLFKVKPVLL